MTVCIVSSKYPPEYAGSGLRAHRLYQRLQKKYDIRFTVLASSITRNKSETYIYDDIKVKLIANKKRDCIEVTNTDHFILRFTKKLFKKIIFWRNYCAETVPTLFFFITNIRNIALIHVFGNVTVTSAAVLFSKITRKPIIIELVNLTENIGFTQPRFFRWLIGGKFPSHAKIVCISKRLESICLKKGYNKKSLWCRPNQIDEKRFFCEPERKYEYRKQISKFSENDIVITHIAKFEPLKNQIFIVQVMPLLPEKFKLVIAGPRISSGPLYDEDNNYFISIKEYIKNHHLEDRVEIFPDFVENPEIYMKASDIFVFPSTREAFGTPVLESLACGVPVITSHIPEVFDQWIQDGVNGYTLPFDHKLWAEKLMSLIEIDQETLTENSREILSQASTEVIDKKYYEMINQLLRTE